MTSTFAASVLLWFESTDDNPFVSSTPLTRNWWTTWSGPLKLCMSALALLLTCRVSPTGSDSLRSPITALTYRLLFLMPRLHLPARLWSRRLRTRLRRPLCPLWQSRHTVFPFTTRSRRNSSIATSRPLMVATILMRRKILVCWWLPSTCTQAHISPQDILQRCVSSHESAG